MALSTANLKLKENKMIQKIQSIINANKVEDPIFNAAMAEIVEICEKIKAGTYKVKAKEEKVKIKEEKKEEEVKVKAEKKQFKSYGK